MSENFIRRAETRDLCRIAEIEIFNYRLNFYPIFQNDSFYFGEMQVSSRICAYEGELDRLFVYDDGVVKGFICIDGAEIRKLFVEPVLQGRGVGAQLMEYALAHGARHLWALEKNVRAIRFYAKHGFVPSGERIYEEDTEEYLVKLIRT